MLPLSRRRPHPGSSCPFDQAKVLATDPPGSAGTYLRHDGQLQEDATTTLVEGNSHSSLMGGVGPSMVFALTDAIFEPLAARQVVQAHNAALGKTTNDTRLYVAEAYLNVASFAANWAGAEDATRRAEIVGPAWGLPLEGTQERERSSAATAIRGNRGGGAGVSPVWPDAPVAAWIPVLWSNPSNRPPGGVSGPAQFFGGRTDRTGGMISATGTEPATGPGSGHVGPG